MASSVRQAARRQALEAQVRFRQDRAEADRRRSALGVDVVVALKERDAAVSRYEYAAGQALLKLTRDEHLAIAEACEWAGGLAVSEGKRLRLMVEKASSDDGESIGGAF